MDVINNVDKSVEYDTELWIWKLTEEYYDGQVWDFAKGNFICASE